MNIKYLLLIACFSVSLCVHAVPPSTEVELLIASDETVLGQAFEYPEGRAKITAVIITLQPGTQLARHSHPVPLFGYMLQGELIVDYGAKGERIYRKGDALIEAFDWPHQGRSGGKGVVKILAVYAGADGVPNTVITDED